MTPRVAMFVLLAACGRIGFDPLSGDGAPPRVCGVPETAPASIFVGGIILNYGSFLNDPRYGVGGASAIARDADTGVLVTMGPSDTDGYYLLTVETGGAPRRLALRYEQPGYLPTTAYSDLGLYRDTIAPDVPLWSFGAGPVWTSGQMTAIYDAANPPLAPDASAGTLNVAVRDCADDFVEEVAVAIEPAPQALRYQNVDGLPADLPYTVGPFAHVIGFNAAAGSTRVTGTIDGRQVLDQTVMVTAGETTLAIVRVFD